MCVPDNIISLNNNEELDFRTSYNLVFRDADIVANLNVVSNYYDMYTISSDPRLINTPLFLSVNIQSLNSKYEELRHQIIDLCSKNIIIDVVALQEIWEIFCPDSLAIPGYQFVYKMRQGMRGGGIGFYIRNGLNFKVIDTLSPFENKIIESLTLQISYPEKTKPVLLTSVYRSYGPLPNTQQMEKFMAKFDELLHNLNNMRQTSYIFIDSNIDLLNLHANDSLNYLNSVILNGFLQCTMKATRFQNNSKTLISHILTSGYGPNILTGTVISDISDHFFTLICPNLEKNKNVGKSGSFTFIFSNKSK
jgi:exonuclease III